MSLAEQIIDGGPYVVGDLTSWHGRHVTAAEANALREELLELRRLRAAGEARKRFQVDAIGDYLGEADICLSHDHCGWDVELSDPFTLAELVQRADEHAEVCR